jgi:predicted acyl esterase
VIVRAFDPAGDELLFHGANDPHTPLAQGWLRASHRALDHELSTTYRPYHTHDRTEPLSPGEVVELDIEIWPTSIVVPAGYRLALTVRSRDYEWDGPPAFLKQFANPLRGCGPLIHDDPTTRTPAVADNDVTIHTGGAHQSHIIVPVVPASQ